MGSPAVALTRSVQVQQSPDTRPCRGQGLRCGLDLLSGWLLPGRRLRRDPGLEDLVGCPSLHAAAAVGAPGVVGFQVSIQVLLHLRNRLVAGRPSSIWTEPSLTCSEILALVAASKSLACRRDMRSLEKPFFECRRSMYSSTVGVHGTGPVSSWPRRSNRPISSRVFTGSQRAYSRFSE